MIAPKKPKNEEARLKSLWSYGILDTSDEAAYDEIVELTRILTGAETAVVSLVDRDRQWFKAKRGLDVCETPRDISFCGHTINETDLLEVPDALNDPRFHDNPLVTGGPKIRFYAGAPLCSPTGEVIGSLCAIDSVPRTLSQVQRSGLKSLAQMVMKLLELKKAERQVKENEQLLLSFFKSTSTLMGVVDVINGDILHLYGNEALCSFFQVAPENLYGKFASELGVPAEHIALWVGKYEESKKTQTSVRFDYEHKMGTEIRNLEATLSYIQDVKPGVSRYSFVVEDMTERMKIHHEVHAEKEKLRMIAANIGDVIWMTDPNKNEMLFISPAYEKIWEKSCQSLYEKPETFLDPIHPEDRPRVLKALSNQAYGVYNENYRIVMPDGRTKWIQDRSFPIRGPSGKTEQVVGLASDISDKVRAEQLIEVQRLSILQSSRLSAVGEMAAGVAHEINNPLAIIRGTTQLLLKEIDNGLNDPMFIRASAEKIDTTVVRIAKIIQGLRIFARDGKADPKTLASLKDIVSDSLEFCKTRFENSGVSLSVEFPSQDVKVSCRSVQIAQVLLNLLNNAFDAALGSEPPWVKVKLEDGEKEILLGVSDSGPPISPEVRMRMMEPFFTTKGLGKGTGLGLSVSKGIVEQHGGNLFLDPESPNTRIVVKLPKN